MYESIVICQHGRRCAFQGEEEGEEEEEEEEEKNPRSARQCEWETRRCERGMRRSERGARRSEWGARWNERGARRSEQGRTGMLRCWRSHYLGRPDTLVLTAHLISH